MIMTRLLILTLCICVVDVFSLGYKNLFSSSRQQITLAKKSFSISSSNDSPENSASLRRNRRKSSKVSIEKRTNQRVATNVAIDESVKNLKNDNIQKDNIEDMFGLNDDQLKDLYEQELPVPREDLITRTELKSEKQDKDKVFQLPELTDFVKGRSDVKKEKERTDLINDQPKVDRSNRDEYLRAIQMNPFADADDSLFVEEYDILAAVFGTGKLLNIPIPYLQTGHGILGLILVLAAFVYAPGNPLTEFPFEIRNFLKSGLAIVYSINMVLAVQAYFNAKSKNLPGLFWAIKTFLLGGVAYYEIVQAKDPTLQGVQKKSSKR